MNSLVITNVLSNEIHIYNIKENVEINDIEDLISKVGEDLIPKLGCNIVYCKWEGCAGNPKVITHSKIIS